MLYNKTMVDGKSEVEEQFRKDKEKYEIDKQKFYADPRHWDNNKRKRAGLHTLRNGCNKDREKKFRSFRISQELFEVVDNLVEKCLRNKHTYGSFFDNFVKM